MTIALIIAGTVAALLGAIYAGVRYGRKAERQDVALERARASASISGELETDLSKIAENWERDHE